MAYDGNGDFDRAITDYDEAIRLNPGADDTYNNRGISYFHKKEFDRAIADHGQAIQLSAKYPRYF